MPACDHSRRFRHGNKNTHHQFKVNFEYDGGAIIAEAQSVILPSSGWGLIDWCSEQILPWVRYIRLQRSKYHYETHPRAPQFRKDQNTNGALERFLLVRYRQRLRIFLTDNSPPNVNTPSSNLENTNSGRKHTNRRVRMQIRERNEKAK